MKCGPSVGPCGAKPAEHLKVILNCCGVMVGTARRRRRGGRRLRGNDRRGQKLAVVRDRAKSRRRPVQPSISSNSFVTGHDADGETLPGWAGLALTGATVAVYMGRAVAAKVAARLIEAGLNASTPVAVIENASRPDRRAYAGRLDELAALASRPELSGPVLFLIGEVVAAGAIAGVPASLSELAA